MTSENKSNASPHVFSEEMDCGLICQAAKNSVTVDEELNKTKRQSEKLYMLEKIISALPTARQERV